MSLGGALGSGWRPSGGHDFGAIVASEAIITYAGIDIGANLQKVRVGYAYLKMRMHLSGSYPASRALGIIGIHRTSGIGFERLHVNTGLIHADLLFPALGAVLHHAVIQRHLGVEGAAHHFALHLLAVHRLSVTRVGGLRYPRSAGTFLAVQGSAEDVLSFAGFKAAAARVLVEGAAVSRLGAAHIEGKVTSLVPGVGFDPPHIFTLAFDGGALTVEAVALAVVAFHQVLDVEVGRAFAMGPGAKLG